MIKTYIQTLLAVLLAGAQMAYAQGSMDDILSQLDVANESEDQSIAPAQTTSSASVSALADAEPVAKSPVVEEESAPVSQTLGSDTLSWLLNKGQEQYKLGNYGEAVVLFDGVLAIDKYNKKSVVYRKRASQRIAAKEFKKKTAGRARALSAVDAAWNPEPKGYGVAGLSGNTVEMDPDEQVAKQIIARLKAIVIPSLDFSDAAIEEVARSFAEFSRKSGEDVDILLVGMETATADSNVTLSVSKMSLYEALQYVVEVASLKFEIRQNLVVIMPANYVPASAMVAKSYDIVPEVGTDLESVSDSAGGAADLFGDAPAATATGPIDVAGFFSLVEFPEGASAVYQPRFKKLFVKNTEENLKALERVLSDLEEQALKSRSQQVEIDARFVEFSEGALEELGFDWNVYGSGSTASMLMDPRKVITDPDNRELDYTYWTPGATPNDPPIENKVYHETRFIDPNTGQRIYNDGNDRPGQNVFGSAQRDNTQGFEAIQSGLLGLMGGTPATMMLGNGDIDVQISALKQEGTADVLSAPRITTKSGSEALIRIAETHRYPQDYDVETGQSTPPAVKPQDWEDIDLGVSLKVTPVVDADSGTIDLELHPEILKFKGYDEYIVTFNAYNLGATDFWAPDGSAKDGDYEPIAGDGADFIALMPSFDRRSVQTQVTVADGATIVLGGLIDERTETFRDQVPFLGDIPYLGRLFRTEGSRNVKKNLTVFVKATMVDPRGMTREERKLARQ